MPLVDIERENPYEVILTCQRERERKTCLNA